MNKLINIESICDELNKKAHKEGYFKNEPVEIDYKANEFVKSFAHENGLVSHTVTPCRWWFESHEHGMYDDGEIELYPIVKHANEKLHPGDKNKEIKFITVNVKHSKITQPH